MKCVPKTGRLNGAITAPRISKDLSYEMFLRGIEHQREFEMPLFYKGQDVGGRRVEGFFNPGTPKNLDEIPVQTSSTCPYSCRY